MLSELLNNDNFSFVQLSSWQNKENKVEKYTLHLDTDTKVKE